MEKIVYNGRDTNALEIYKREIARFPNLSKDDQNELVRRSQAGDLEARDTLTKSVLRYVVARTKSYAQYGNKGDIDYHTQMDLIQEATLGIFEAIRKFDPGKGFTFLTFATHDIRQKATRALSNGIAGRGGDIRMPIYVRDIFTRISKIERSYLIEHGRLPTREEYAEVLEVKPKKIDELFSARKLAGQISINLPLSKSPGQYDRYEELGDTIPGGVDSEKIAERKVFFDCLEDCFDNLPSREAGVLRERYLRGKFRTLEEVGNLFELTRERIRQIEIEGLKHLREYIDENHPELAQEARELFF